MSQIPEREGIYSLPDDPPTAQRFSEILGNLRSMADELEGLDDSVVADRLDTLLDKSTRNTLEFGRIVGLVPVLENYEDIIDVSRVPRPAAHFVLELIRKAGEPYPKADMLDHLDPNEITAGEAALEAALRNPSDELFMVALRTTTDPSGEVFMFHLNKPGSNIDSSEETHPYPLLRTVVDALADNGIEDEKQSFTETGEQIMRVVSYRGGKVSVDETYEVVNYGRANDELLTIQDLFGEVNAASKTLQEGWGAGSLSIDTEEGQIQYRTPGETATEAEQD